MADEVMRQVPYECTLMAGDTKSGKPITNTLYYYAPVAGAFGADLAGSDQATMNASILARWTGNVLNVLSAHYVMTALRSRAIVGWKWSSPLTAVIGSSPGLTFTSITTAVAHGLVTNDSVKITDTVGVT